MYLFLFHGRPSPDMDMDERGTDGPVIGPCKVSFTYGGIKIHPMGGQDDAWEAGIPVAMRGDCIQCAGTFYGDAEVWTERDLKGESPVTVKDWSENMNGK